MPFKSQAQQRMMFATQPKTAEKWAHETPNIKKLPQHVKREDSPMQQPQQQASMQQAPQPEPLQIELPDQDMGVVDQYAHPGCDDQIGDIHVVLKPGPESKIEDILHKTHAFGVHQFDPHTIHGVYGDEGEANLVGEGAIRDLHKHLTKVEKKKDTILEKIGKKIHSLQKEINNHMKSANERPEESDTHHMLAEKKMNIIRSLRDKHKAVKASKKELPKKDEK
jgi:hypothetical protein